MGQIQPHSAYRGSSQPPQIPAANVNWGGGLEGAVGEHGAQGTVPPVAGRGPAGPAMEPSGGRKERPKGREPAARLEKAKQRAAQQELKQRQRAEIYALNRVMTELEQRQFDAFCKQMQAGGE